MIALEFKIIILVPVFQREVGERGGISKLEIGKVPVQNLSISVRQVQITGRILQEFFQLPLQLLVTSVQLLHSLQSRALVYTENFCIVL